MLGLVLMAGETGVVPMSVGAGGAMSSCVYAKLNEQPDCRPPPFVARALYTVIVFAPATTCWTNVVPESGLLTAIGAPWQVLEA